MVTVALAGATTGLGLTFLHTFLHLNAQDQEHKIVLLSRSEQPEFSALGVDLRTVDYADHAEPVKALQGVHTVLSLIGGQLDGRHNPQLDLLKAAKEAGVQRFAPSEYAGNGYEGVEMYRPKAEVWKAVRKSGIPEYTRFNCGLFMSVLATGTPKEVTEVGLREGRQTGEQKPWQG